MTPPERVAIVGSREFPQLELVREYVLTLDPSAIVISGGARGVDSAAEEAARKLMHEVISIRPNYQLHGKSAPFKRNSIIAMECTRMVAFWDGVSKGTMHACREARRFGKEVKVFTIKHGAVTYSEGWLD